MNRRELEAEIFCLLDGELDGERAGRLEVLLISDPEARRTYRSCACLHSALAVRMRGGERAERWNVVPRDKIIALQRRRSAGLSLAAAAAVILLIGSLLWLRISHGRVPDGYAFKVTPGSQFSVTHPADRTDHTSGELLPGSRMTMRTGNAECELEGGVRMLVEAPFDLTLVSGGKVKLGEGFAWFHVPAGAEGFRVITREMEIVDLGTEFGVASTPDADDEVHVFDGKVRAESLNPVKGSKLLLAGEAVSTDAAGRLHPLPVDRARFLSTLPEKLKDPAVYHIQSRWIGERFLVVENGKLAAGTVRGDNGRWVLEKDGGGYLIKNPSLRVYLSLEDGSETVVPVRGIPAGDRGRWRVEPSGESFAIANKATGKYLNIEDLSKPPASNLDKIPTRSRWTSGLWNLTHVGGGEASDFDGEK